MHIPNLTWRGARIVSTAQTLIFDILNSNMTKKLRGGDYG